jgi:hypothetical protein
MGDVVAFKTRDRKPGLEYGKHIAVCSRPGCDDNTFLEVWRDASSIRVVCPLCDAPVMTFESS